MSSSTFVITGASRGLGLEFVRQLAAKGNTVFALVRNPEASEKLQTLVDNKHVFAVKIDTSNENSIKSAAEEVSKYAPEGIDVLINNAGTHRSPIIEDVTSEDFTSVFETNVVGVNNTIKAFLPLLRKRGKDQVKKILNISSILGSIEFSGYPNPTGPPAAAYNTSKAALNMIVRLWAYHLQNENFIVYSSHPGWVKTDMGGENAHIDAVESISGQLIKLESATLTDNGGFFDYTGKKLPW